MNYQNIKAIDPLAKSHIQADRSTKKSLLASAYGTIAREILRTASWLAVIFRGIV